MLRIRFISAVVLALWCLSSPCAPQSPRETPDRQPHAAASRDAVDINRATLEQLMKVPGLARPWAERILRFRPYRSKVDLLQTGVLPGDVYNRVKQYIIAHHEPQ